MLKADTRHIAYCDIHSEDNVDFKQILAWQKSFDPHRIILNGDVTLAEYASHWNERHIIEDMGHTGIGNKLEKEFRNTEALLRRIREASPNAEIDWVPGNHERWYVYMARYHPRCGVILGEATNKKASKRFKNDIKAQDDSLLAPIIRRHFRTDGLEINVLPFHEPLRIGPLTYLHGDQFQSVTATTRFYPNTNLVIGHFHQKKITPIHDSGRRGHAIQHFAVPTLMKLGRGYEQMKSSNHSNGFFYANTSKSGLFEGFIKDVFGDAGNLFPWQV